MVFDSADLGFEGFADVILHEMGHVVRSVVCKIIGRHDDESQRVDPFILSPTKYIPYILDSSALVHCGTMPDFRPTFWAFVPTTVAPKHLKNTVVFRVAAAASRWKPARAVRDRTVCILPKIV